MVPEKNDDIPGKNIFIDHLVHQNNNFLMFITVTKKKTIVFLKSLS